jgi:DNA-3-methyladenine glycosylase I
VIQLLQNPRIIRHRLKINSTITNARAFLNVQDEYVTFDRYIWQFVGGEPKINRHRGECDFVATPKKSVAMSHDLKGRGFKSIGSTICYAFRHAAGMINDHLVRCFRHPQVQAV